MLKSIGAFVFGRWVGGRFWEGPLWEAPLYIRIPQQELAEVSKQMASNLDL